MDEKELQDAPLQSDQEETKDVVTEEVKQDPADNLTPDHPRFKKVLDDNRQLREEMEDLRRSIEAKGKQSDDDDYTEDEAAALAKIEAGLRKRGELVTKADLDIERNALKLERLSDRLDGKNGSPKFSRDEVVVHAKRNGFGNNFEAAYRDLHHDALVQSEAKKLAKELAAPTSERPNEGDRSTKSTQITPEQIAKMTDEEYAANREKIIASQDPRNN